MRFLKNKPVFLILLPVFFVFHGFTENYDFVPVKDALLLAVIYTAITLAITGIAWLYFRDLTKAALIASLVTGYNFIFGSIQDTFRLNFPGSFISRYSFILPVSLVIFLLLVILLKRRKYPLQKLSLYLNLLFLLLIAIDGAWLTSKTVKK